VSFCDQLTWRRYQRCRGRTDSVCKQGSLKPKLFTPIGKFRELFFGIFLINLCGSFPHRPWLSSTLLLLSSLPSSPKLISTWRHTNHAPMTECKLHFSNTFCPYFIPGRSRSRLISFPRQAITFVPHFITINCRLTQKCQDNK
jgi:hypothetical protein